MENSETRESIKQITNYEGKKYSAFVFSFLGLVVADQLSKFYAENIFKNSVFAFSLPLPIWLIYGIYGLVVVLMVVYVTKHFQSFSKQQIFAWVLIFAGACSNIIERIILGYVRDWIYIGNGVFNIADLVIILGIVFLLSKFNIDKNDKN